MYVHYFLWFPQMPGKFFSYQQLVSIVRYKQPQSSESWAVTDAWGVGEGEGEGGASQPGLWWGGGKEEKEKNLQGEGTYVYSLEEEERGRKAKQEQREITSTQRSIYEGTWCTCGSPNELVRLEPWTNGGEGDSFHNNLHTCCLPGTILGSALDILTVSLLYGEVGP